MSNPTTLCHPDRSGGICSLSLGAEVRVSNPTILCHPDRSGGTCSLSVGAEVLVSNPTTLCHPDRSEAEWRDLQFVLGSKGTGE